MPYKRIVFQRRDGFGKQTDSQSGLFLRQAQSLPACPEARA